MTRTKFLHTFVIILLILLLVLIAILTNGIYYVNADLDEDIIVEDLSTDEAAVFRYTNIDSVTNKKSKFSLFSTFIAQQNPADVILDAIGLKEEDLGSISKEDLVQAKSIMTQSVLIEVDSSSGEIKKLSAKSYNQIKREYSDITNDNGKNGYMAGTLLIVQNPIYNIVKTNKDSNTTIIMDYGFEVECTMRWLVKPTITTQDSFSFGAWNGSVHCSETQRYCNFYCDYTSKMGNSSIETQKDMEVSVSETSTNGWPVFMFNLPTDITDINMVSYKKYDNMHLSSSGVIYAKDDFDFTMAYFHKQISLGSFSVSLGAGGFSVSTSGTIVRKYEVPSVHFYIEK